MPKLLLAASVPGDRLEHQVDRRAAIDRLDARCDVGQHARLRRDVVALDDLVQHFDQRRHRSDAVGRGIDADHRIAAAVHQPVNNARGDAGRIIGRMVGLKPRREPPFEPDGVAEPA